MFGVGVGEMKAESCSPHKHMTVNQYHVSDDEVLNGAAQLVVEPGSVVTPFTLAACCHDLTLIFYLAK